MPANAKVAGRHKILTATSTTCRHASMPGIARQRRSRPARAHCALGFFLNRVLCGKGFNLLGDAFEVLNHGIHGGACLVPLDRS